MNIIVSNVFEDEDEIFKARRASQSFTAEMVNTDVLRPQLKLLTNKFEFNYITIPDFENRHYFVKDKITLPSGHIVLDCEVDALYSWASYITELNVNVIRNEVIEIGELVDETLPMKAKHRIVSEEFGDNLSGSDRKFILCGL